MAAAGQIRLAVVTARGRGSMQKTADGQPSGVFAVELRATEVLTAAPTLAVATRRARSVRKHAMRVAFEQVTSVGCVVCQSAGIRAGATSARTVSVTADISETNLTVAR
jgi:hypothetical protein